MPPSRSSPKVSGPPSRPLFGPLLPSRGPAPPQPQEHCLACRAGKQSFFMNHPHSPPDCFFTSWTPNSSPCTPTSPSSTLLFLHHPLPGPRFALVLLGSQCALGMPSSANSRLHPDSPLIPGVYSSISPLQVSLYPSCTPFSPLGGAETSLPPSPIHPGIPRASPES